MKLWVWRTLGLERLELKYLRSRQGLELGRAELGLLADVACSSAAT